MPLGDVSSDDNSVVSTRIVTVTVTDHRTSATLHSQTSARFDYGSLHRMFMFGSTSSPIGKRSKDC